MSEKQLLSAARALAKTVLSAGLGYVNPALATIPQVLMAKATEADEDYSAITMRYYLNEIQKRRKKFHHHSGLDFGPLDDALQIISDFNDQVESERRASA